MVFLVSSKKFYIWIYFGPRIQVFEEKSSGGSWIWAISKQISKHEEVTESGTACLLFRTFSFFIF